MRPSLQWIGLGLVCAAVIAHQTLFWDWFIEDAAISFAYAKHLASGEGLVPFPGGERVEGYSNPTWVLAMALPHLLGIDVFAFAKWSQLALAVSTTALVYLAVRDAQNDGWGPARGLIAAVFLAACSPFALWGSAGLEGGLLSTLIALAIWRMGVELDRESTPWSALVWCLVALTRPEGILYAAVGGLCTLIGRKVRGKWLAATSAWLVLFFVPFGLHQLWRWWYFAWPLPNTYYGKLAERQVGRMAWSTGGWRAVRDFFHILGYGYFLPVWLLGALSPGKHRPLVAIVLIFVVGTAVELGDDQRLLVVVWLGCLWAAFILSLRAGAPAGDPGPTRLILAGTAVTVALVALTEDMREFGHAPALVPTPEFARKAPPYVLVSLAVLVPMLFDRAEAARRFQLRIIAWGLCCAVLLFAVYVQWDWMKGFRWFAPAAVPGAILFAFGVDGLIRFVQSSVVGRSQESGLVTYAGLALLVLAAVVPAGVVHSRVIAREPDASPQKIKIRVDYVERVRRRIHIEDRLVDLDVDQGAHLYWSNFEMMDFAGLIDVPFAHNHYDKPFVREYLFEERRPHIAHVHGSWAQRTKIPTHPEWREGYFELPPYPTGRRGQHPGTFLRRDLVLASKPPEDTPIARFENDLVVYGLRVPSEPGIGRKVYVEIDLGFGEARPKDFRLILFATDGKRVTSYEIPPGYDWVSPKDWRNNELFMGRFDLPLPSDLPPGQYALGLVVLGEDGAVVSTKEPSPSPLFARGEQLTEIRFEILTLEARAQAAVDDRKAALRQASALDCEGAERHWQLARYHRAGEESWRVEHEPEVYRALATCWARSSDGRSQEEQVRRMSLARQRDHHAPSYRERAASLAADLTREGLSARARGDWETAYRRFSDAVDVDRRSAWARRWAEETRALRLDL